jgi:hypothetical protein
MMKCPCLKNVTLSLSTKVEGNDANGIVALMSPRKQPELSPWFSNQLSANGIGIMPTAW